MPIRFDPPPPLPDSLGLLLKTMGTVDQHNYTAEMIKKSQIDQQRAELERDMQKMDLEFHPQKLQLLQRQAELARQLELQKLLLQGEAHENLLQDSASKRDLNRARTENLPQENIRKAQRDQALQKYYEGQLGLGHERNRIISSKLSAGTKGEDTDLAHIKGLLGEMTDVMGNAEYADPQKADLLLNLAHEATKEAAGSKHAAAVQKSVSALLGSFAGGLSDEKAASAKKRMLGFIKPGADLEETPKVMVPAWLQRTK